MSKQDDSKAQGKKRMYQRKGSTRWYIDLRDLGGGREALVPEGHSYATTDDLIALDLAAQRVKALMNGERARHFRGIAREAATGAFAREWLEYRRKMAGGEGYAQAATLRRYEKALAQLFRVFNEDCPLHLVKTRDVKLALVALRTLKSRSGGTLSSSSVRQVIAAMQLIYDHASDMEVVPEEFNPWRQIRKTDRPQVVASSTDFLEVYEGYAFLTACDQVPGRSTPLRAIVETLLLTGGRKEEVLGLEVSDIDFHRETIRFRSNQWRRIKSGEERTVPMWPQLKRALKWYLQQYPRTSGLLFCTVDPRTGAPRMITALAKAFRKAQQIAARTFSGERAERFLAKRITPRTLRPTYCAARLQTVDGDKAIATWTVRGEMGHRSLSMINAVYGRLGTVRHRSAHVEYVPLADDVTSDDSTPAAGAPAAVSPAGAAGAPWSATSEQPTDAEATVLAGSGAPE